MGANCCEDKPVGGQEITKDEAQELQTDEGVWDSWGRLDGSAPEQANSPVGKAKLEATLAEMGLPRPSLAEYRKKLEKSQKLGVGAKEVRLTRCLPLMHYALAQYPL